MCLSHIHLEEPQVQCRQHSHNSRPELALGTRKVCLLSESIPQTQLNTMSCKMSGLFPMISRWTSFPRVQEPVQVSFSIPPAYFFCLLYTHAKQVSCTISPLCLPSHCPITKMPFSLYLLWNSVLSSSKHQCRSHAIWSLSWLLAITMSVAWALKSDISGPHPLLAADFTCLSLIFPICIVGIMLLLISRVFRDNYTSWLIDAKCLSQSAQSILALSTEEIKLFLFTLLWTLCRIILHLKYLIVHYPRLYPWVNFLYPLVYKHSSQRNHVSTLILNSATFPYTSLSAMFFPMMESDRKM